MYANRTKEGGRAISEEIQLAIDCATQHIQEFLVQATSKEKADFGRPCGDCKVWKEGRCKDFDWLKNMNPIFSQSGVKKG